MNNYVDSTVGSYYVPTGEITGVYSTTPVNVTLGNVGWIDPRATLSGSIDKKGIHPQLYFKYIRSKFKILERSKLDKRLAILEKAFDKVVSAGQIALGEKIMKDIARESKESMIYAKGVTVYVERSDLFKHKHNLREGHISDTKFADFTRVIPDKILKRKKELECVFDGFVIFHYWHESQSDVKKMSSEEKAKMKDPVLFGVIAETDRLYFIDDWEDEHCDLTFEEIVDVIGKSNTHKITGKNVSL